jgi:hypothetical protein
VIERPRPNVAGEGERLRARASKALRAPVVTAPGGGGSGRFPITPACGNSSVRPCPPRKRERSHRRAGRQRTVRGRQGWSISHHPPSRNYVLEGEGNRYGQEDERDSNQALLDPGEYRRGHCSEEGLR